MKYVLNSAEPDLTLPEKFEKNVEMESVFRS